MFWNIRNKIGIWLIVSLILTISSAWAFAVPQMLQARLEDGVSLRLHLPPGIGEEGYSYARQVLEAACAAYREIVFKRGFNRCGYTFSSATRLFAYDSDRTIDIYLTDVEAPFALTQAEGGLEYRAEVFVPLDYWGYRKRYKIAHPQLELKASLAHELLHIITYSYNRNMQTSIQGKAELSAKRWDWYTEGLARYFETLVGYRQEFLSSGFRKNDGKKIMVYKGGVNYFLCYPDKPLAERKYDFALFWQYLHTNYGMDKIEEVSFRFRQIDPQLCSNQEAMQIIAQTLGLPLKNLLCNFSLYVYEISSLPAKVEDGVKAVSLSKLSPKKQTSASVCSFGFDFYEIDLTQDIQTVQLKTLISQKDLNCLVGIHSPFGFNSYPFEFNNLGRITINVRSLPEDTKTIIIILSNPTDQTISYRVCLN